MSETAELVKELGEVHDKVHEGLKKLGGGRKLSCNRCGTCCERVHITISPLDLYWDYMKFLFLAPGERQYKEVEQIAPMLEPIGEAKYPTGKNPDQPNYIYHCSNIKDNLDGTKSCGIYEDRPTMCKVFGENAIKHGIPEQSKHFYPNCSLAEYPKDYPEHLKKGVL